MSLVAVLSRDYTEISCGNIAATIIGVRHCVDANSMLFKYIIDIVRAREQPFVINETPDREINIIKTVGSDVFTGKMVKRTINGWLTSRIFFEPVWEKIYSTMIVDYSPNDEIIECHKIIATKEAKITELVADLIIVEHRADASAAEAASKGHIIETQSKVIATMREEMKQLYTRVIDNIQPISAPTPPPGPIKRCMITQDDETPTRRDNAPSRSARLGPPESIIEELIQYDRSKMRRVTQLENGCPIYTTS
jgi:hypothetical protein